jgi:hypothetical protein
MTVKRRFAQFSGFWVTGLWVLSWGSVQPASAAPDLGVATNALGAVVEVSSPSTMDGSILLVSLKLPAGLPESDKPPVITGNFGGIDLPFYKDGDVYRSILGIPYDHQPGVASVKVRIGEGEGASVVEVPFTITPGEYESETLSVDSRRVKPQNPKDLRRIKRESIEIGEAYRAITPKKYWDGPFALPIPNTSFTSKYGARRIYNGVQKSAHLGLDFKARIGTPIRTAAPGRVLLAKNLFFTGNTVIVDHGYGVLTLYAHLSKLRVKKNQEVKAGKLLGLSGKTGRVTGPHLHWMAVVQKQKVNPLDLTKVMR